MKPSTNLCIYIPPIFINFPIVLFKFSINVKFEKLSYNLLTKIGKIIFKKFII